MVGINPNAAASAYAQSQNITGQGQVTDLRAERSGDTSDDASTGGVSFASLMKHSIRESVETMRTGEEMSAKAITGEADITDVVQAVTAAELTLQTVVTVRDRMISAYQDIMRMPI